MKNSDIDKILAQYSYLLSSENVGDDISEKKIYPEKYERLIDLHGDFEQEALSRTKYFLKSSKSSGIKKIRIVTGIGKRILFFSIKHLLEQEKERKNIFYFKTFEENGFFDVFF